MFLLHLIPPRTRLLLVAAHPDDETIGAGGLLYLLQRRGDVTVTIAHLTDGAPPDSSEAQAAGFSSAAAYARARRRELASALQCLRQTPRWLGLGFRYQELARSLPDLVAAVSATIAATGADIVMTHPYEGGHPDHDAAALAASAAVRRAASGESPAHVLEMTSYHWTGEALRSGEFIDSSSAVFTLDLDPRALGVKQRMLDCFETQRTAIANLALPSHERFRQAPQYDFTAPPNNGRVFYDYFNWGVTSREWCALAREAIGPLGDQALECL